METFTDIFKNYKKYSADALKEASIMQAISSAGMFLAGQKNINDLKVTRPNNLSTDTLSLNSYDMSRGALDNLDKSFNTMLRFSRESGRDINPSIMSGYSRSATDIASKQAALNNDVHNKEAIANFEASNKTKTINAQIEANYLGAKDKLDMAKAGMRVNNLGQLTKGIANIENMNMAREDALGKMGTESKYLDISLGLHNRSVYQDDKFLNNDKFKVPELDFGELHKGFNVNNTTTEDQSNISIQNNNENQSSTDKSNIEFNGLNDQQGFDISRFTPKLNKFNFESLAPYSGVKLPKDLSVYSKTKSFGGYSKSQSDNLQNSLDKNNNKQYVDSTNTTRNITHLSPEEEAEVASNKKQQEDTIAYMGYEISHPDRKQAKQTLNETIEEWLSWYMDNDLTEEEAKALITKKYNERSYNIKANNTEK